MIFEIEPNVGAGPLTFGMTVDAVRKALDAPFVSFMRTPDDDYPTDHFESLGVFGVYDTAGILVAIEFARPAQPMLDGNDLLATAFVETTAILRAIDPAIEVEADGAIAFGPGISLYAPAAPDEPDAPCESVMAFAEGYYD